jgi:uncharacterized phiE125 gp8 family phage protein
MIGGVFYNLKALLMYLQLDTAPAVFPVTVADLKDHLRVSNTASDTYLAAILAAAADELDGPTGKLRRALISQTWRAYERDWPIYDRFGVDRINLPLPPLQSVTSVKYYDADNALQTLPTSAYHVVISTDGEGCIERVEGQTWPTVYERPDAIEIEFIAGYGDAETDVPDAIRHAVRLIVGDMFADRGDAAMQAHIQKSGTNVIVSYNQVAVDRLLKRYVWPGAIR